MSGLPLLATGIWSVLFGLYAYLLPFVLFAERAADRARALAAKARFADLPDVLAVEP